MRWWSRAGSVSRVVAALVGAAALLAREAEAAIRRARGKGSSASSRRPSASRSSPAQPPERGRGCSGQGASARPGLGRGARGRARGSAQCRERGAAAEHEALGERVRGEPVRAVQARAGALAHGVAGRAARSARRGRSPRRPSCSGRRAPRAPGRARGRCPTSASAAAMLGKRRHVHRAQVEADRAARRCAQLAPRSRAPPGRAARARPRSARRSSSSSVAPSPRTASVMRKPSRGPSRRSAVGWNCMNSRSASAAPAALREREPGADRPARVRGPLPRGPPMPPVARITAPAR